MTDFALDFGAGTNTATGDTLEQAAIKIVAELNSLAALIGTPTPTPGPSFTSSPTITSDGTPQVGEPLTGVDAAVSGLGGNTLTRRWLLGMTVLAGTASYTPTQTGVHTFQNRVIDGLGNVLASTSATITVAAATPTPTATSSIKALTIDPAYGPTSYPPRLIASLKAELIAPLTLHGRYSTNTADLTGPWTALPDVTVNDTAVLANSVTGMLSGLTTAADRLIELAVDGEAWSPPVQHGPAAAVAPTLTSSLTPIQTYQGGPGSTYALTADRLFTIQQEGGDFTDEVFLAGGPINPQLSLSALPGAYPVGAHKFRFRLVNLGGVASAIYELPVNVAANRPAQFTFTDVTGANINQTYTGEVTITGIPYPPVVWSSPYPMVQTKADGTVLAAATSGPCGNNDKLKHSTSIPTYSTEVDKSLTVADVTDTFSVTTIVNPAQAGFNPLFGGQTLGSLVAQNSTSFATGGVTMPAGKVLIVVDGENDGNALNPTAVQLSGPANVTAAKISDTGSGVNGDRTQVWVATIATAGDYATTVTYGGMGASPNNSALYLNWVQLANLTTIGIPSVAAKSASSPNSVPGAVTIASGGLGLVVGGLGSGPIPFSSGPSVATQDLPNFLQSTPVTLAKFTGTTQPTALTPNTSVTVIPFAP